MDLHDLLENLDGLSDDEVDARGRDLYDDLYAQRRPAGTLTLPDGESVTFQRDRFEHAFHTSADRIRHPYSKAKVARDRVARIRWIGAVLQGNVPGSECWLVRPPSGYPVPLGRLYIVWQETYVVWLERRKDDSGWRFSSAYVTGSADIRRYIKERGVRVAWRVPEKQNAP